MGELRKDYILDRWVIISEGRGKRPKQFVEQEVVKEDGVCVFCSGNESLAPAEIGRVEKNGKWVIRWFENKFPALAPADFCGVRTDNRFYTFGSACGAHEVVVETPEHARQLADLSSEELAQVFCVFRDRIRELSTHTAVEYVSVFKNHGVAAGTSIVHAHWQIMATAFVPSVVMEKVIASRKFVSCPYCQIIASEKRSDRRCFENEGWVAFTPYAPRFNYEVWLFPKQHVKTMEELSSFEDFSKIFKQVLIKIKELNCSYNVCVHYAPAGQDLHVHIEILPRIAVWGGFELGTGATINSVYPEQAARFYRGEING